MAINIKYLQRNMRFYAKTDSKNQKFCFKFLKLTPMITIWFLLESVKGFLFFAEKKFLFLQVSLEKL